MKSTKPAHSSTPIHKWTQKGGTHLAIMMVMGAAGFTLLLAVNSAFVYMTRQIARVKEGYKVMDAMETASVAMEQLKSQARLDASPMPTPQPLGSGGGTGCAQKCKALFGGSNKPQACADNPDDVNSPFCFYKTEVVNPAAAQLELKYENPELNWNFQDELGSRLVNNFPMNRFFSNTPLKDPTLASLFQSLAYAQGVPTASTSTIDAATITNCAGGGLACMSCDSLVAGSRTCVTLYTCPMFFKSCTGYDPTVDPATALVKPIFAQTIYLLAPNDRN